MSEYRAFATSGAGAIASTAERMREPTVTLVGAVANGACRIRGRVAAFLVTVIGPPQYCARKASLVARGSQITGPVERERRSS
jgi:hypothetical protein